MRKLLNSTALRNVIFVLLLISIASGLDYLSYRHPVQHDLTFNISNSLEAASITVLRQLKDR